MEAQKLTEAKQAEVLTDAMRADKVAVAVAVDVSPVLTITVGQPGANARRFRTASILLLCLSVVHLCSIEGILGLCAALTALCAVKRIRCVRVFSSASALVAFFMLFVLVFVCVSIIPTFSARLEQNCNQDLRESKDLDVTRLVRATVHQMVGSVSTEGQEAPFSREEINTTVDFLERLESMPAVSGVTLHPPESQRLSRQEFHARAHKIPDVTLDKSVDVLDTASMLLYGLFGEDDSTLWESWTGTMEHSESVHLGRAHLWLPINYLNGRRLLKDVVATPSVAMAKAIVHTKSKNGHNKSNKEHENEKQCYKLARVTRISSAVALLLSMAFQLGFCLSATYLFKTAGEIITNTHPTTA